MNCLAHVESEWLSGATGQVDTRLRALLKRTDGLPIAERLRELAESGLLELPAIGEGDSTTRLRALAEIGAADLSLARLAEGHADALSVLRQAGQAAGQGLYGVWVAGEPPLITGPGEPALTGERPYCSGTGIIDRALVTGKLDEEVLLLEIDARRPEVIAVDGTWPAVGMATTASYTVLFAECPTLRRIGAPGFYRDRVGFWQGSLNVAACWYGGALGLARTYLSCTPTPSIDPAAVAEIDAALRTMVLHLNHAANESDRAAPNVSAELLALRCRNAVYQGCRTVLNVVAEAGGTHLATHNAAQARRLADLPTYLRQHHPGRDGQRLGELLLSARDDPS